MMLYLVKWADGSSALVNAEDEDHLIYLLDQLADPGLASWQLYDGPLWLEFPRPDKALPTDKEELDPNVLGWEPADPPDTDWACEFVETLLWSLHPNLAALRDRAIHEERGIKAKEMVQAVAADKAHALPSSLVGSAEGPEH